MPGSDRYSQILDRPMIFTNLVLKCSFLKQSLALDENTWIVNLVITKCCNAHFARWLRHLLRSVAAIKIHMIMRELLIMREPQSGRSWTSKVFNTVITLDTYQFIFFWNYLVKKSFGFRKKNFSSHCIPMLKSDLGFSLWYPNLVLVVQSSSWFLPLYSLSSCSSFSSIPQFFFS